MRTITSIALHISKSLAVAAVLLVSAAPVTASAASAATSAQVKEAQIIMTKFGIPAGPVDGKSGAQTARGLCIFRYMASLPSTRAELDSTTLLRLRAYNKAYSSITAIPARSVDGNTTYLTVNQTCQAAVYAEGGKYQRAMAVSTGQTGHGTTNGTYKLGYTDRGWHCSTRYPTCSDQTGNGRFATKAYGTIGNMYNRRQVFHTNGQPYTFVYLHGSTSVPTYPASHECIRVTVTDSDWMYDHVGNHSMPRMYIIGKY